MRLPKALRAARENYSYVAARTSPFDFLTAGNRGNDIPDALRGNSSASMSAAEVTASINGIAAAARLRSR